MGKENPFSGELMARGMEHNVLWRPDRKRNGHIAKVPRLSTLASVWPRRPADVIREELCVAQSMIAGTEVKIPKTSVRAVGGAYVMRQEYVAEDRSILDVSSHLESQGLNTLVDEFKHEPRNFVSKGGTLYWVDPTRGTVGRILERAKLMKVERYRKVRRRVSKLIRAVGL